MTIGADIGSYTHHLLVRGKPNICRFMVRTKVKNKGSKAAAANSQKSPKLSRSVSCPDATASRSMKRGIMHIQHNSGINNEMFTADNIQSTRDISTRTMPSTIEDDFADDLFNSDPFDVNFSSTGARNGGSNLNGSYVPVSVDGMSHMNSNITNTSCRNDLPSMLLCEDNIQDDITALGNSSRSNDSHASDTAFQQAQLDPFQPQPIPEQNMHHRQQSQRMQHLTMGQQLQQLQQQRQQQQQQQQQQQRLEEQQREQECRMLQLQIQQLQSQIVNLDQQKPQHQQQRMNTPSNNHNHNHNRTNYLCNGVAAIEPSDRGTVTPTLSPSDSMVLQSKNNLNRNRNRNHPLRQLEKDPLEVMLDPTPIFTPLMSIDRCSNNNCNNMSMDMDMNMNNCSLPDVNMSRSISFNSFPQHMVSGNVM